MATPMVPEPVASFWKAVNAHDEQGFLDAFTPEGSVDDWGRIFTGREEIKAWSDKEFIGARGRLDIESASEQDGQVTVIGDWKSNYANGRSNFIFEIQGSKLSRMAIREG